MKIEGIQTTQLHNNEHFEFMSEVDRTITAHTPAAIDIAALYPAFKECFETEDESYKLVVKSAITRRLSELDAIRDNDFVNFRAYVKSLQGHYLDTFREAAYRIMVELNAFGNVHREGNDAETADITNIIQSLRGKLAAHVATVNINEWVDQLEQSNLAYVEAAGERYEEQSDKNMAIRLRKARLNTDVAYRAIVNRINAGIEFNGPDRYSAFVFDLNARIKHYNNIIATRKGRNATAKNKEDELNDATNDTNNPQAPPTNPPPRDNE